MLTHGSGFGGLSGEPAVAATIGQREFTDEFRKPAWGVAISGADAGDDGDIPMFGQIVQVVAVGDLGDGGDGDGARKLGDDASRGGQPGQVGDQQLPVGGRLGPVPRPGVVESDSVAGTCGRGPRRSDSPAMQDDVEVDPVAVMVSHGVVTPLCCRRGVDVGCPVDASHDRRRGPFAVGRDDGEVHTYRGVAGPLKGEGFGIVDLQRDTAQAWTQLNRLDDRGIREAHFS